MRPVTALLCLGLCVPLAGCLTPGPSGDATPELAAAPAPAPSAPTMPAGRGATAPKPAPAAPFGKDENWWMQGGVTREKINSMCWMKYETGRKDLPVEKRADLVNQCVIEKKKEYPFVN